MVLLCFLVKSDFNIGLFEKRFQVNSPIVLSLSHQVDLIVEFLKKTPIIFRLVDEQISSPVNTSSARVQSGLKL